MLARAKFFFPGFLVVFIALQATAQGDYFQQAVNYTIGVSLNDSSKTLRGFETIVYHNNSRETLTEIYFHLWPNAYKNNETALAKQLLRSGNTRFHYAKEADRGFIDSLSFKVNAATVKWAYDAHHIDICKLLLNTPLAPGDSITITTPFFVKLPRAVFSRMGHMDDAVCATQWYPKPAVFDRDGWHPMPYLDQGEFYSEFGAFDVRITLPENYVLAATGDRVESFEEEQFLREKLEETKLYLATTENEKSGSAHDERVIASAKMKTVRFLQHNVHDFAWFANKRWLAMKEEVVLPESGRKVQAWVFFLKSNAHLWRNAVNYVRDATLFYSKHVGEYPYNHVTAVDGNIMAGGGMEYPNITVIGDTDDALGLDIVITHEVGHNWFYGMLASNERRFPFLDEGFNSYYEMRYTREKYPDEKFARLLGRPNDFKLFGLQNIPYYKFGELGYMYAARAGEDQALDLHAADYSSLNYGAMVYGKTALVLDYLEAWMGKAQFDKSMKTYFENRKFKHPSPGDFFADFSSISGVDLSAFRNNLFTSTRRVDYSLRRVNRGDSGYRVKVRNLTGVATPLVLQSVGDSGQVLKEQWFDGFSGTRTLEFSSPRAAKIKIDAGDRIPEINRRNNTRRTTGIFRGVEPLKMRFITSIEDPSRSEIYFLPLVGGNYYNGLLTGMALHNYGVMRKKFEFVLAPMWGWGSHTPAGFASADYSFYPGSVFRQVMVGASAKSYAYNFNYTDYNTGETRGTLNYYKLTPFVEVHFNHGATSRFRNSLKIRSVQLFTDSNSSRIHSGETALRKYNVHSMVHEASYNLTARFPLHPFRWNVTVQANDRMAKAFTSLNALFAVSRKQKLELRAFAGVFLGGDGNARRYYAFRAAGLSGYQDYLFDHNFVARNEYGGFGFSQFADVDGAMKVYTPFGQSGTWLAAVNLKSPKLVGIKLFADAVFCDPKYLAAGQDLMWAMGVNLPLVRSIVDVYIPVLYSDQISVNGKFIEKIRFTLNLHKLEPRKLLRENSF